MEQTKERGKMSRGVEKHTGKEKNTEMKRKRKRQTITEEVKKKMLYECTERSKTMEKKRTWKDMNENTRKAKQDEKGEKKKKKAYEE